MNQYSSDDFIIIETLGVFLRKTTLTFGNLCYSVLKENLFLDSRFIIGRRIILCT